MYCQTVSALFLRNVYTAMDTITAMTIPNMITPPIALPRTIGSIFMIGGGSAQEQ